jgi:hypothetical protein
LTKRSKKRGAIGKKNLRPDGVKAFYLPAVGIQEAGGDNGEAVSRAQTPGVRFR